MGPSDDAADAVSGSPNKPAEEPAGVNPQTSGDGADGEHLAASHAHSAAEAVPSSVAADPGADDDLLAALTSMPAISHIDHTLDQLVSSVDLFDVPAFDFDDTT